MEISPFQGLECSMDNQTVGCTLRVYPPLMDCAFQGWGREKF
jgi:hypothetical protein